MAHAYNALKAPLLLNNLLQMIIADW